MLRQGGGWQKELHALLDALLAEEGGAAHAHTVVDIGANVGAFSLYAASLGCKVWSFEMQPLVQTMLELSRRANGFGNMHTVQAALWNESGLATSFTSTPQNPGGTGLSIGTREATHARTVRFDEAYFGSKDITLLKIDVEESEEYVLDGMGEFMKARHIVMETRANQWPLIARLQRDGYACGHLDRVPMSNEAILNAVRAFTREYDLYCRRRVA